MNFLAGAAIFIFHTNTRNYNTEDGILKMQHSKCVHGCILCGLIMVVCIYTTGQFFAFSLPFCLFCLASMSMVYSDIFSDQGKYISTILRKIMTFVLAALCTPQVIYFVCSTVGYGLAASIRIDDFLFKCILIVGNCMSLAFFRTVLMS